MAQSWVIVTRFLLVTKKLGMLICNNSSFNWDVTLTSWESTLTLSEPQSLEVFSPICLPEGTVPPAFFEVGTFLEECVSICDL